MANIAVRTIFRTPEFATKLFSQILGAVQLYVIIAIFTIYKQLVIKYCDVYVVSVLIIF